MPERKTMTTTNRERMGKALDLLRDGLAPYVQREMKAWRIQATVRFGSGHRE